MATIPFTVSVRPPILFNFAVKTLKSMHGSIICNVIDFNLEFFKYIIKCCRMVIMESNKFLKTTFLYFFGDTLSKLIIFLLLPIYTLKIKPHDYGYYDYSLSIMIGLTSILNISIWIAVLRFMRLEDNQKNKVIIVNNGLIVVLFSNIILSIISQIFLRNYLNKYLALIIFSTILSNLVVYWGYVSRGYSKNKIFAFSGIIQAFLNSILNFIFLVNLNYGVYSLYISSIISSLIVLIYLELNESLIKNFSYKNCSMVGLKRMLSFVLPIWINQIFLWLVSGYGRVAISKYLSYSDNGLYAIANRLSAILFLFASPILLSWQEAAYSKKGTILEKKTYYSSGFKNFFIVIVFLFVLILPILRIAIPIVIDNSYSAVIDYVPIVFLSMLMYSLNYFLGLTLEAVKRTWPEFFSMLAASFINILMVWLLMEKYKVFGVLISLVFSYIITSFIRYKVLVLSGWLETNLLLSFILFTSIILSIYTYIFTSIAINILFSILIIIMFFLLFKKNIIQYSSNLSKKIISKKNNLEQD